MAIKGIIFDNQYPTAKNFGAFLASALSDGRCYGGDVSFSGGTITVHTGVIMACGRAIEIASNEEFKVPTTSGYFRIVLTINLATTASNPFAQATISPQFSANNTFAALTQQNINSTGSRYEMEICLAQISSGTVTNILRKYPVCGAVAVTDTLRDTLVTAAISKYNTVEKPKVIEEAANNVMTNKAPQIQTNAVNEVMNNRIGEIRNNVLTNFKLTSGKYGTSLPSASGHSEGEIFILI